MSYEIRYPCKSLARYVKYFWIMDFENKRLRERIVPTGEIQLLFHYKNPFREFLPGGLSKTQPQSVVCGQVTSFKDVETCASCGVIGVIFFPFSARFLLPIPLHEITDYITHPSELSPGFRETEQQLMECDCTNKRIQLIESFLKKQFTGAHIKHFNILEHSINLIQYMKGRISVIDTSRKFEVPERQFQRMFRSYVGISPQRYIEITKFNYARALMDSQLSLTQIAYKAGYYDQPQFNRVFKKYTGYSPKMYRSIHCCR